MPAARAVRRLPAKRTHGPMKGHPMKKLLALLFALLLCLPVPLALAEEAPLNILTLNFPAFDFSRQVAGERAQVRQLLPPGADAHSFEPSPRDLIALMEADLLVYNGGIGEHWVKNLLASLGNDAPPAIAMMDLVDTVAEELVVGMEDVPHAHGHDNEEDEHEEEHEDERELDEHVWTSPPNAILISQAIAEALMALDPEHADAYEANFLAYRAELEQLDADFRALVAGAMRRTIVLGDRFPMRYFTREYGLAYFAAFPGCSAQTEPSARTIAFLMDSVKQEDIPVVFHIEFSNRKASGLIAAETSAVELLLHSAHNVSAQEMEHGITYLDLMRQNLNNLREALY